MVKTMITPADLARMLAHAADEHTQNPMEPDELLYTSQSVSLERQTIITPSTPTPAMMPQRRTGDGPTTFASLDAQELPVVREYSAGGLVFDDHGRVAIIARHSRSGHLEWCLPKGHIEKGETPQQTAVREVHEETGILGEVVDSIATIDYWFTGTSQRVHKLVHHFALRQIGGELTVEGDPDHEAEDAIWVDFNDLDDVLSYPNERKIAWLYARKLNRQA
jgi:8-oxo-dGTP pyrophosphatase MutT (NUDIX family)